MNFALLQPFEKYLLDEFLVTSVVSNGNSKHYFKNLSLWYPQIFNLVISIFILKYHFWIFMQKHHQVCIFADDVIHEVTLDVTSFSSWFSWWHWSYELKIFIEFCWLNFHKNLKIERFLTKNLEKRMKFSVANRYMTFIIHIIFKSVSTKFLICLPKFSYIEMILPHRKLSHS